MYNEATIGKVSFGRYDAMPLMFYVNECMNEKENRKLKVLNWNISFIFYVWLDTGIKECFVSFALTAGRNEAKRFAISHFRLGSGSRSLLGFG